MIFVSLASCQVYSDFANGAIFAWTVF